MKVRAAALFLVKGAYVSITSRITSGDELK